MKKKLLTAMLLAMTSLFAVARASKEPAQANETRAAARAARQAQPRQARPRRQRKPRTPRPPRRPRRNRHHMMQTTPYYIAPRIIYVDGTPRTYYVANTTTQVVNPTPTQTVYVCNQTTQATGTGATADEARLNAASIKPTETQVFRDTNNWTMVSGQCFINSKGTVILPAEYKQFNVDNVNNINHVRE